MEIKRAWLDRCPDSKRSSNVALVSFSRNEVVLRSANLSSQRKLGFRVEAKKDSDPFRGKSGSILFGGLSHQSVEESKLESAPFKEEIGSLLWVLAPVALISALIVPQFFIVTAIESAYKNEVFAGARELFYYLKGGHVDYGEEHSKACGHLQLGRVYEQDKSIIKRLLGFAIRSD
ncbi:hypothetical protein CASFOL_029286 [Castilleja foliolosa]|uniref:Lipase-like C-terminal domain-containing protein n=1 Tax=Castilleja foliolosa TaxID=1961234 RepID=A0ABD3CC15_9LAMI